MTILPPEPGDDGAIGDTGGDDVGGSSSSLRRLHAASRNQKNKNIARIIRNKKNHHQKLWPWCVFPPFPGEEGLISSWLVSVPIFGWFVVVVVDDELEAVPPAEVLEALPLEAEQDLP